MYNTLSNGLKSRFYPAKEWIKKNSANIVLFGQFWLIALIFFGLGIVYTQNFIKEPPQVTITEPSENSVPVPTPAANAQPVKTKNMLAQIGNLVASKNGETYYLTTCKNNIKEENKIYFQTEEDAKKAGFRQAKNCFKEVGLPPADSQLHP